MCSRQLTSLALAALLATSLVACSDDGPPGPGGDTGAVGTSKLAPENQDATGSRSKAKRDRRARHEKQERGTRRSKGDRDRARTRPASGSAGATSSGGGGGAGGAKPAPRPAVSGPLRAAVSDPRGDVRGTVTGAPPYADLTGAALTRGDDFQVRVSFAGSVPQRQTDDRIVQVATFYDVDGDGETDYEVWASLADDGWGTSYRTPDGARFGEDSGARARPDGDDLVLTFPLGHLRRASRMSWAVGAQWGTVEQVAAGTTSKDNAPDGGWARFPG